jgi:hypothetical protein
MVFPQQNLINPKILHLFVDQFNTLLTSTTGNTTTFYQTCQTNCINFLSLYDLETILPGNSPQLEIFINSGRTQFNMCGFAGNVSLYDPATSGLDNVNKIITSDLDKNIFKIDIFLTDDKFNVLKINKNEKNKNTINGSRYACLISML